MRKKRPGRVQLLQRFLSTFRMEHKNRVCIGMLKDSFFEETDTKPEDSENFVDYARSMEGVDIGVLIEERNGQIKGSFRAKNENFRVDLLAKEFNGGGTHVLPVSILKGILMIFIHCLLKRLVIIYLE